MDFIQNKINTFIIALTNKIGRMASYCHKIVFTQAIILRFFFLFLLCLITSDPAYADKKLVLLITNNNIERNKQISLNLWQSFSNNKNISVEIHHYQNISKNQITRSNPALIISLGSKASKLAPYTTTLYALIPKNSLKDLGLCKENDCANLQGKTNNHYAIYLDQPLSRQLNFLTLLLPDSKKIGVVTASFSLPKLKHLQLESTKLNLTLKTQFVANESEMNRKTNQLLREIDVLFTLPDPLIHNRNNIPYLLLSTYRHNIPVIGFSKAYVNAGAIAAIYSSSSQIVQQIKELAMDILDPEKSIQSSSFPPKYFSIAINNRVARSLELYLPNKEAIKSKLLRLEK